MSLLRNFLEDIHVPNSNKKNRLLGKEKNITPSVIKNISSTLFFKGSFFEIIQQLIQSLYSDMLFNFAIDKNEILYQPIKFSKSVKLFTATKRK